MAVMENLSVFKLERATLGRSCTLGQMYDTSTDTFMNYNLATHFTSTTTQERLNENTIWHCLSNDFQNDAKPFGIDPHQYLSLLIELHDPCSFTQIANNMQAFRNEVGAIFIQRIVQRRTRLTINRRGAFDDQYNYQANHYYVNEIFDGKLAVLIFRLKSLEVAMEIDQAKEYLRAFLLALKQISSGCLPEDVKKLVASNPCFEVLFENLILDRYFNDEYELSTSSSEILVTLEATFRRITETFRDEKYSLGISLLPICKYSHQNFPILPFPVIDGKLIYVLREYEFLSKRIQRKFEALNIKFPSNILDTFSPRVLKIKSGVEERRKNILMLIRNNVLGNRLKGDNLKVEESVALCQREIQRLVLCDTNLENAKAAILQKIDKVEKDPDSTSFERTESAYGQQVPRSPVRKRLCNVVIRSPSFMRGTLKQRRSFEEVIMANKEMNFEGDNCNFKGGMKAKSTSRSLDEEQRLKIDKTSNEYHKTKPLNWISNESGEGSRGNIKPGKIQLNSSESVLERRNTKFEVEEALIRVGINPTSSKCLNGTKGHAERRSFIVSKGNSEIRHNMTLIGNGNTGNPINNTGTSINSPCSVRSVEFNINNRYSSTQQNIDIEMAKEEKNETSILSSAAIMSSNNVNNELTSNNEKSDEEPNFVDGNTTAVKDDVYAYAKADILLASATHLKFEAQFRMRCPCSSTNQILPWLCFTCKSNLLYGFEGLLCCPNCGMGKAVDFRFYCGKGTHEGDFLRIDHLSAESTFEASAKVDDSLNILILGESGVGKSTFVNAMANYLTSGSFDEVQTAQLQSLIHTSFSLSDDNYQVRGVEFGAKDENEVDSVGSSRTQSCRSYLFQCEGKSIRLIDTPGVGDTSGIEKDNRNFLDILNFISQFSQIHGILLLLKPNNSRLNVFFRFCIQELLRHLHHSASENIVFVFTNAKSTFYRPGDTLPILKEMLTKVEHAELELSQENVYCLDNEAFRYLIASRQGFQFTSKEISDYRKSWSVSVTECQRLLSHIRQLKPHSVRQTTTLTQARQLIINLQEPLCATLKIMIEYIIIYEMEIKSLRHWDGKMAPKLFEQLSMPDVQLKIVKTESDFGVVCEFPFCTDTCDSGFLNAVTCHSISNAEYGNNCDVVGSNPVCQSCGCDWFTHRPTNYVIASFFQGTPIIQIVPSVLNHASQENQNKFLENHFLERLNKIKHYLSFIVKTLAKMHIFTMSNTYTLGTPKVEDRLDRLLRIFRQSIEVTATQDVHLIGVFNGLRSIKEFYSEEVRKMQKYDRKVELTELTVTISSLYEMERFGPVIKEAVILEDRLIPKIKEMSTEKTLTTNCMF